MDESEFRKRPTTERWFEEEDDCAPPESSAAGNKRRRSAGWRPPGWLTLALFFIMVSLIVALAYLRDEKPPWDDDLTGQPPSPDGSRAQVVTSWNGEDLSPQKRMKAMLKAAAKLNLGPLADKPPWDWDTPSLGNVLEKHGAALDNFTDLSEDDPELWAASNPVWKKEDLGGDPAWPSVVLLKEAEVAYLARRDQEEAAMSAALDLLVMASLLEHLDAWPSYMHRALDLHKCGAQCLAILLQNTRLSEAKLKQLQLKDFKLWEPSGEALAKAMNGFYQLEKKLIMGPEPGDVPLPPGYMPARSGWLLFKPNATLRLFAESFRELKDEARQIQVVRVNQISSRAHRRYSELKRAIGGPNASGEEYFLTRVQEYMDLLDQHSFARARFNVVMAQFAIRRYVMKTGKVPTKLDELVPEYLAATVLDPFSGEPLRYRPAQGLIYSVGPDLKDEGGRPTPLPLGDESEPTARTGIVAAKVTR